MLKSINKVIKVLILSDLVLMAGWGMVVPIFAIFIIDKIQGGDVRVAGMAIGIYWLVKSVIQIPIARYLDKRQGEKDDYYALIAGTLLTSFVPLGFIFAFLPWHIYILQGLQAIGMAFAIPSWSAIFTRHIDKEQTAFSWSLDSSALGIGAGVAGIVGGTVAKVFGFTPLFIGVSVLGIISTLLFLLIQKDLSPKEEVYPMPKPH